MEATAMLCALYARVSTVDQAAENQIRELRRYVDARGWTVYAAYVDRGVSGSKQSRPQLDAMLRESKRRQFDAIAIWSLDRLGRDLKHLIGLLDDLHSLGVSLVSLREGLDWSTPSGRLQAQLLGMIAEFERSRIQERVRAGLQRAKAQGKRLGRPRARVSDSNIASLAHMSTREAAARLGVSKSFIHQWRLSRNLSERASTFAPVSDAR
jgi:DNA invertase Pin-like site-specific DNA recombinase